MHSASLSSISNILCVCAKANAAARWELVIVTQGTWYMSI